MILGICTGQVYITLNLFIIVLEACMLVEATSRSDKYTNFRPASCHSVSVTRTENGIAVKSYIRHKQLFSCLDRKSK